MRSRLIGNVQVLRLIAASMVLVTHTADLTLREITPWLWAVPWSAGVDLFFVISGFVMATIAGDLPAGTASARQFLVRRAIRIVPSYWLFTTIMVVLLVTVPNATTNTKLVWPITLASFLFIPWPRADGLLNPLVSQGWTLNYEAFFYTLVATMLVLRNDRRWLVAPLLVAAATHALIPSAWFAISFWTDPIILEFAAGIGLAALYRRGIRIGPWASLALTLMAVASYVLLAHAARVISYGLPTTLVAAALILLPDPAKTGGLRRAALLGGDASYALYLSHPFVVHGTLAVITGLALSPWLRFAFCTVMALLFAIGFWLLIERRLTSALNCRFGGSRDQRQEVAP